MSQQPPESSKEGDEPVDGERADQQQRETLRAFAGVVRMRLVEFARGLKARRPSKEQCHQYYDSTKRYLRDAADHATPVARRIDIAQEYALDGIATVIERIITPPFQLFWRFLTYPEAVMALFTVVLTAVTYYQWEVTDRTLQEFKKQGQIATGQLKSAEGQLKQAERAAEQTERIIRLENRAWLYTRDVGIRTFTPGKVIECMLPVNNSGPTPGTIVVAKILAYFEPSKTPIDSILRAFESELVPDNCTRVVPPHGTFSLDVEGLGELTTERRDAINARKLTFYIVGKLRYLDALSEPHETRFAYEYIPHPDDPNKIGSLYSRGEYSHMD